MLILEYSGDMRWLLPYCASISSFWVQAQLALQVRVIAEASATLTRGVLTLALLKGTGLDVGIALSLAQVGPQHPP